MDGSLLSWALKTEVRKCYEGRKGGKDNFIQIILIKAALIKAFFQRLPLWPNSSSLLVAYLRPAEKWWLEIMYVQRGTWPPFALTPLFWLGTFLGTTEGRTEGRFYSGRTTSRGNLVQTPMSAKIIPGWFCWLFDGRENELVFGHYCFWA